MGHPASKATAGAITRYSGVDTTHLPDQYDGGHLESTATTSFMAPGVQSTANDMVVAMFANTGAALFTPQSGMVQQAQDQSNVRGQAHVTIETATVNQSADGSTGDKTATTSASPDSSARPVITDSPGGSRGERPLLPTAKNRSPRRAEAAVVAGGYGGPAGRR